MINPFAIFNFMDNLTQYIGQESMFCFSFFILALVLGFLVHQCVLKPLGWVHSHIDYDEAMAELPLSKMKEHGCTTYPSALSRDTWNRIAQGDVEALKEALSSDYKNKDLICDGEYSSEQINQDMEREKHSPQFHFSDAKEQDLQNLFQALFYESGESHKHSYPENETDREIDIEK